MVPPLDQCRQLDAGQRWHFTRRPKPGDSVTGDGDVAIFDDEGQNNSSASLTANTAFSLGSLFFGNPSQSDPVTTNPLSLTNDLTLNGSALTLFGTFVGGHPVAFSRDESTTGNQVINDPIVLNNSTTTTTYSFYANVAGTSGSGH